MGQGKGDTGKQKCIRYRVSGIRKTKGGIKGIKNQVSGIRKTNGGIKSRWNKKGNADDTDRADLKG